MIASPIAPHKGLNQRTILYSTIILIRLEQIFILGWYFREGDRERRACCEEFCFLPFFEVD